MYTLEAAYLCTGLDIADEVMLNTLMPLWVFSTILAPETHTTVVILPPAWKYLYAS